MTPQEQQLLEQLAQRINETRLTEKDPEAEAFLGKELGKNPDALYIFAQTVLIQDITLQQANSHIADLERQIEELQQQLEADEQEIGQLQQEVQQRQQPAKSGSFLGRIFGNPQPGAPPPQSQFQPVPQSGYQQSAPAYQPVQQYAPPAQQYQQPQYIPAPPMGGMPMGGPMMGGPVVMGGQPSFLQGAMQTAAGVAAGTLAVEGVESLLHGFGGHHGGGYGLGGFDGGYGGQRPVEEVINNYYGDDREREHEHHDGSFDTGFGGEEHSHHEGARFADTGSDNFADPGLNSELDDTDSFNDTGSYDDSSNFDDNSSF